MLALVFSILFIWYSRNTGHSFWAYWAPHLLAAAALLLGIPVYLGQRRHIEPAGARAALPVTIARRHFDVRHRARRPSERTVIALGIVAGRPARTWRARRPVTAAAPTADRAGTSRTDHGVLAVPRAGRRRNATVLRLILVASL